MKVVHFTTVHPPTDVRIYGREGRSLIQAGYELTIIAPTPRDDRYPTGVKLILIPNEQSRFRESAIGAIRVLRQLRGIDADIYHFHDPELLPVGLWLSLRGKRVIYDSHEDSSETISTAKWIPKFLRTVARLSFRYMESLIALEMSAVIAANPAISKRFAGLNKNIVQISNYPSLADFQHISRSTPTPGKLVAFGGISPQTCVVQVVSALELIPKSRQFELVLAGFTFSPDLLERIRASAVWSRVRFVGRIPRDKLLGELSSASVSVVLYSPEPNHYGVGSNRFFESLAAGVPVITSDFPAWRSIVGRVGCGLTANPTDPRSIANAIEYLLDHPEESQTMGDKGRQAFLNEFNWEREEHALLKLYRDLAGTPEVSSSSCAPDCRVA